MPQVLEPVGIYEVHGPTSLVSTPLMQHLSLHAGEPLSVGAASIEQLFASVPPEPSHTTV